MEILIRDSLEAGAQLAASIVRFFIQSEKNPVLGFATGGTPLSLYQELIRMQV